VSAERKNPLANADLGATDLRPVLERFVVENDDLLALESLIGRFNIFDALGITRVEIRHSNFLAFILDPAESHGQGQLFLKALLMDLLKNAPPQLRPLSPIDLDGTDLRGVEVEREWKNIDLLITCKEPRFAVVVENKVDSKEHSDQLNRYRQVMADHHPGMKCLFVFLTPDGDEPSEADWVPYTYTQIHSVLKRVRDTYQNAIGDEVLVFVDHYLDLLGTRFMDNKELDDLCRRIYQNHRQALDVIWERVGNPEAAAFGEVVATVEQDPRWDLLWHTGKKLDFMPKTWRKWLPSFGPDDYYPFCVHVRSSEEDLAYTIFVGPMDDDARRKKIVAKLREEATNCGFKRTKASEVGGNWARIAAVETILKWPEDEKPEADEVRAAVKKALDELFPKLEKLAAAYKPLI